MFEALYLFRVFPQTTLKNPALYLVLLSDVLIELKHQELAQEVLEARSDINRSINRNLGKLFLWHTFKN